MTTAELVKWLRDNSSGIYRPSAEAADLIEELECEVKRLEQRADEADAKVLRMVDREVVLMLRLDEWREVANLLHDKLLCVGVVAGKAVLYTTAESINDGLARHNAMIERENGEPNTCLKGDASASLGGKG